MKKLLTAFIVMGVVISDAYALINLGLKGGYMYESLTPKEIHQIRKTTIGNTTRITDTTYTPTGEDAETKHPKGLGGEAICEISPPVMPMGIELGIGSYTTSFTDLDIDTSYGVVDTTIDTTKYTHTINSIKLAVFVKYFVHGIPMVSTWIGVGPFLGLNMHKIKVEELNIVFEGERITNFGILSGIGASVWLLPNLSLNTGFIFSYFITSKGKATSTWTYGNVTEETTSEFKFSQWNIGLSVGVMCKIM